MRAIYVLASLGVVVMASSLPAATSTTLIGPGDSFLLGGEQRAPVSVEGQNIGTVPVEVIARKAGRDSVIATLAPRARVAHRFAVGEIAVFRNTSPATQARMALKLNQPVNSLSMRYALPQN